MCSSKFHAILQVFSRSCCAFFRTCTVIKGSAYCTAKNLIHLYAFLVKINAFGFEHQVCFRADSIICTSPLVWRESSFLCVLSTNDCIFSILNPQNWPALISKLNWWFSSLFTRIFSEFLTKWINHINPYKIYLWDIYFWKRVENPPTTQAAMADMCRSFTINKSNWHND